MFVCIGYFSHNFNCKIILPAVLIVWSTLRLVLPFPEMVTVSTSPRPSSMDSSVNVETETDYLKIAKKGGGHKG